MPHMAVGVSLEASVLPALGAAQLWRHGRATAQHRALGGLSVK